MAVLLIILIETSKLPCSMSVKRYCEQDSKRASEGSLETGANQLDILVVHHYLLPWTAQTKQLIKPTLAFLVPWLLARWSDWISPWFSMLVLGWALQFFRSFSLSSPTGLRNIPSSLDRQQAYSRREGHVRLTSRRAWHSPTGNLHERTKLVGDICPPTVAANR